MKSVHVAVAVIENGSGDMLIAKRPDHLHMGGFWEFPGGKVEADETALQALQREIQEEVALDVHAAEPLLQIPFQYPDKNVLLDVWCVKRYSGDVSGCEGQQVAWVPRSRLHAYQFPPANRAILTALQLSDRLLVTGNFSDAAECLQRTRNALENHGIRAVLFRAHHLDASAYESLAAGMEDLCRQFQAKLLLNTDVGAYVGLADGLHLSAQRLSLCSERPVATSKLFGVSCHNENEIRKALAIGADYILLSPVLPTATHPAAAHLGWDGLAALLAFCSVPVFALGGLDDSHQPALKALGVFGVAGIRAWW
jgi:8-oxo-dGTP diphosphatase